MDNLKKRYFNNKYRKKGFTLIELLAIIVILAIVVMIAVSFTVKIVETVRKEAFRQTTKGTVTAIEKNCTLQSLYNEEITTSYVIEEYEVTSGKDIQVKGQLPLYATASVDSSCNVQIVATNNKYCATKEYNEEKVKIGDYIDGICETGSNTSDLGTGNTIWDGWISMTLYYPIGSTNRQWRLGSQGEVRYDETLMWQNYTGSITVRLDRTEDIWIRYELNNETVTIPPIGTVLVDIEPDSYGTSAQVSSVNVKINYDDTATIKEYRVGDSDWMTYTGEFTVTENVMIEARASKPDNVYDTDGNLLVERTAVGRDAVYIGNVGVVEDDLAAPTIERLTETEDGEVAKVKITYPAGATRKIYKLNYGIEQTYTDDISISRYGTYIIAYYYDANGKRSKSSAIYINNPSSSGSDGSSGSGGGYDSSTVYTPNPPLEDGESPTEIPTYVVAAPIITANPTTSTTGSVQVTVSAPSARTIYIKKGTENYVEYTTPITVTNNTLITAYYITSTGEMSSRAYYQVGNIYSANSPYLKINATPFPYSTSYGINNVNISLDYSNADLVEFSLNGIEYTEYTGSFELTQNATIYARATNSTGITTRQLAVTNIGNVAPSRNVSLQVDIMAFPEPTVSNNLVAEVTVQINYDSRALIKYYQIGDDTNLIQYTGPFLVTSNTTIYAYAISNDGTGSAVKQIDNLLNGISAPYITASPSNGNITSSTTVTIEYDQNAIIKRYSINKGALRDYTEPIEVDTNSTIYAYNSNAAGDQAYSTYNVSNIVAPPVPFILDMGEYYILKLNYSEQSSGREYKWGEDGTWKTYNQNGILLIKPEYRNQLINEAGNFSVNITNESGNIVDYANHWYVVDGDLTSLNENIFMRWDTVTPPTPEIVLNTLEPSMDVTVSIIYGSTLKNKQYKIVDSTGNIIQDWTSYNGSFTISDNNTTIYARGQDEMEVWSQSSIYRVINIDELQPVIRLTMDLESAAQNIGIRVSVTDDIRVGKVKWAKGIKGESYFTNNGTEILNNSVVTITENAYYTFYAEDGVGNKQVYTINVENIDLTPPSIIISSTPENTVGLTSSVTIDFGDSTTKQYKIGYSTTWLTYTDTFSVSAYTVLANNWQNTDGTVTIYAKGKDTAGNEIIISKKLVNLDLDMQSTPIINAKSGYSILTSSGVKFDDDATISFDSRTDIDNYYSLDNGATWILYTGKFNITSGTIIAKSVKKDTGLTVNVSKTVGLPSDALPSEVYDGNDNTYLSTSSIKYMLVDNSMQGKPIRLVSKASCIVYALKCTNDTGATVTIQFLDENKNLISKIVKTKNFVIITDIVTIPMGTKYITYTGISYYSNYSYWLP
ncbi:MAG: type II secretion system protein [Bacilli bacterium]